MRGLARLISSAIRSWANTGPLIKRKVWRPDLDSSEHFGTDDVGGHEVWRELDTFGREAENNAQSLNKSRLGKTGDADEKAVPAGQHRDQDLINDVALTKDDLSNRFAHLRKPGDCFFDFADDRIGIVGGLHDFDYSLCDSLDRTG